VRRKLTQNIIVIKEICSFQLPPWLDDEEEILFTETWQPRTYFFNHQKTVVNNLVSTLFLKYLVDI